MSEPRQYELIYVIAPDVDDAGVAELHARVEEIVTAGGGKIDKTDNWGRRRLAYEIDRHKEGTYVLELFTGSGAIVGELDRRLKVSDNVLRYLVVRVDEDLRKAERSRAKRQARRKKRRGAGEAEAAAQPEPAAEAESAAQPESAAPAEPAAPAESAAPAEPAAQPEPAEQPEPAAQPEDKTAAEPAAADEPKKAEVSE